MNNAGVLVYGIACLVGAPIVALINAFVIAPLLAFPMKGSPSYFKAIGINTTALIMAIVAIVVWRIAFFGMAKFSNWTIMPWYLSGFLTLPVIAGSLVYSCVRIGNGRLIAVNRMSIAEQSDARESSAQSVPKSNSDSRSQ